MAVYGGNLYVGTWNVNGAQVWRSGAPSIIYVGQDRACGGKSLCYSSIQSGIDSAQSFTIIEITQETYNENVILDDSKEITLKGGWDTTFTSNSSYTTIDGSIMITNGTMTPKNIILK
jgi:hypothetical protein